MTTQRYEWQATGTTELGLEKTLNALAGQGFEIFSVLVIPSVSSHPAPRFEVVARRPIPQSAGGGDTSRVVGI
jgi:hypothetical protein